LKVRLNLRRVGNEILEENRKSGMFVTPGEKLGVIEEFLPGPGTYVEEGNIHAKTTGHILFDIMTKTVSVYPTVKTPNVPKIGSVIVGKVTNAQEKSCSIRIMIIDGRESHANFDGILHISDVSKSYTQSMHDVCKPGDIIKAIVVSNKNNVFHLSTSDRRLGVIQAYCSKCGYELQGGRSRLFCPRCGNTERRKRAFDYGRFDIGDD